MRPAKIKVADNKALVILWEDGEETSITLNNLRRNCPCAICEKEREGENPGYIPLFRNEETTIRDIKAVGVYGINVVWQDDHNEGIYEYGLLKRLGKKDN